MRRIVPRLLLAVLATGFPDDGVVAQKRTWSIAQLPSLRIGNGVTDAEQFAAVVGATRLPNGNILVGDRADHALLLDH